MSSRGSTAVARFSVDGCVSRTIVCLAAGLLSLLPGCSRNLNLGGLLGDGGARVGPSWGEYAGALPLSPCPVGQVLVVDTTDPTFEGGPGIDDPSEAGVTLSLPEAIAIAANRPGLDTILFDENVFPARRPGTVDFACRDRLEAIGVCIDARDRGVILRWPRDDTGVECASGGLQLRDGSKAYGLTFLQVPQPVGVLPGTQIAGCRVNTDGEAAYPGASFFDIRASGGEIGPGNVLVGRWGINLVGAVATQVFDSYFGIDPVSEAVLGLDNVVDVDQVPDAGPIVIEGNVFAVPLTGEIFWDVDASSRVVFRRNYVGVDREGAVLSGDLEGVGFFDSEGTIDIGPGNTIRGVATAVTLPNSSARVTPTVRITQNRIFDNEMAIAWEGSAGALVDAPRIVAVGIDGVTGTCGEPGTIELFHDAADQGESYVGSTGCDGVETWVLPLAAPIPSGRNVTATLTTGAGRTSTFSGAVPVP